MEFLKELNIAIDRWSSEQIEDEWLFDRFRQDCILGLDSVEAFALIGPAVDVVLQQTDESVCIEVLEVVFCLARHSGTTEIPSDFVANRESLIRKFESFGGYANGKLQELFRYYRLK